MRFRVLGPVEIECADGETVTLPRRQERCLLAIFLLEPGRTLPVDRLVGLLWEDDPPAQARRAVHAHVARIRSALARARAAGAAPEPEPAELVSQRDGYQLRVDPDEVDAHRFGTLVERASRTADPAERERLLRAALALWRGPALHNAATSDRLRWLCAELEEQRLQATESAIAAGLELGRHGDLLPELAKLHAEHPLRERLLELRMLALHRQGRTAEALTAYRLAWGRIADELSRDPSATVQRLHQMILRGDPDGPASPPEPRGDAAPAQLPADLPAFTGRHAELSHLDAVLDGTRNIAAGASAYRPVVIAAIAGTAGVGKTALAVHWSHRVRQNFPDGQLYVNLRGFHPDGRAMTPVEAMRGFLHALGVAPRRIPAGLDAQVGLYRSRLADRRVLVLLDNARDADQVRPLLPASSGCLALVTSRDQLTGLVAAGARPLSLGLLSIVESRTFLADRLGEDLVGAEASLVERVITGCAGLPLALAIAAARAQTGSSLATLAAELGDTSRGLDALDTGDPITQARTVFSWSYHALTPAAARLFRVLGLHPGPDLCLPAAASLAGIAASEARLALGELVRGSLVTEHAPGRYACHDLLRAYAFDLVQHNDPPAERRAATHRLLDHYLHSAYAASLVLEPNRDLIALDAPQPGVILEHPDDYAQALEWFSAERAGLLATVQHAAATGFDQYAWKLAWTLTVFLDRQGYWHDWATSGAVAVAASERLGDTHVRAHAHRFLAGANMRLGQFVDARLHFGQALRLYEEVGDGLGQARTHRNLAQTWGRSGHAAEALEHATQALGLYRQAGHRPGEAAILNSIGWYHTLLGDHRAAIALCQEALALLQKLDHRPGQADAWDSLGHAHLRLGESVEAIACYARAAEILADLGHRYEHADSLVNLADAHVAAGDERAARDCRRRALDILTELNHPDAGVVWAALHANEYDQAEPAPSY